MFIKFIVPFFASLIIQAAWSSSFVLDTKWSKMRKVVVKKASNPIKRNTNGTIANISTKDPYVHAIHNASSTKYPRSTRTPKSTRNPKSTKKPKSTKRPKSGKSPKTAPETTGLTPVRSNAYKNIFGMQFLAVVLVATMWFNL